MRIYIALDPQEEVFTMKRADENEKNEREDVNESNNNGLYLKKIVQDKWAVLDLKWHIIITLDQL